MKKIYRLKDKKLSDKYITGLSKVFDGRLFYVHYIDDDIFKFKIIFPRYQRTLFEWLYDIDNLFVIGEGEIKIFEENTINYLELNIRISPLIKIAFLIGILGFLITVFWPEFFMLTLPLLFTTPILIIWIIANYIARSQINLICKIS